MIYECLLERAYEGILQTYCTKDENSAIEWLNNHYDDFGAIVVWKDGEEVKRINYEFDFNRKSWIKVCE